MKILFAVTTTSACLAALLAAYWLQLDEPQWAATTVLIIAQPSPGQVIAKGFWRTVGTLIGAGAAVVMIVAAVQSPVLFVSLMAFWIALATLVSSLLRGFRSYGAVLAGYTAAIVAFAAVSSPDQVFDIAVARGTAIILGIVFGAVASGVLLPANATRDLLASLDRMLVDAAKTVGSALGGPAEPLAEAAFLPRMAAVDALVAPALTEEPRMRRLAPSVGAVAGGALTLVSIARSLRDFQARHGQPDIASESPPDRSPLPRLREQVVQLLADVERDLSGTPPAAVEGSLQLARNCEGMRTLTNEDEADGAGQESPDEATLRDRLNRAVDVLAVTLRHRAALLGGPPAGRAEQLRFLSDPASALRNALRAFVAVIAASVFWIASAWSSGATMVTMVAVICSLFATRDRPSTVALSFLYGTLLAVPFAFVWLVLLLPPLEGFSSLSLALAPVLLCGGLALVHPRTAAIAAAFNVYFVSLLGPTNPMTYDVAGFLNGALATLVGMAFGVVAFLIILPFDAEARSRALVRKEVRLLRHLLSGQAGTKASVPERAAVIGRGYDLVARLLSAGASARTVEGALGVLDVALEVRRIRASSVSLEAEVMLASGFGQLARAIGSASGPAVEKAAEELGGSGERLLLPDERAAAPAHVGVGLRLAADLVRSHADFLTMKGPFAAEGA